MIPMLSISGSGVLGVLQGKAFPEAPMGGEGFMGNFIDDVKLSGFLFQVPSLSVLPWKNPNLIFSRA